MLELHHKRVSVQARHKPSSVGRYDGTRARGFGSILISSEVFNALALDSGSSILFSDTFERMSTNNWSSTRQTLGVVSLCSGFPTRSDINRPVQIQKMARSLKFRI